MWSNITPRTGRGTQEANSADANSRTESSLRLDGRSVVSAETGQLSSTFTPPQSYGGSGQSLNQRGLSAIRSPDSEESHGHGQGASFGGDYQGHVRFPAATIIANKLLPTNNSPEAKHLINQRVATAASVTNTNLVRSNHREVLHLETRMEQQVRPGEQDKKAYITAQYSPHDSTYQIDYSVRTPAFDQFFASDAYLAQIQSFSPDDLPSIISRTSITNASAHNDIQAAYRELNLDPSGKMDLYLNHPDPEKRDIHNELIAQLITGNPNGASTARLVQDFNTIHDTNHMIQRVEVAEVDYTYTMKFVTADTE